jgi:hypothetical protein
MELDACSQFNCEASIELSHDSVSDLLKIYVMEIVASLQCNCKASVELS